MLSNFRDDPRLIKTSIEAYDSRVAVTTTSTTNFVVYDQPHQSLIRDYGDQSFRIIAGRMT